MKTTSTKKILSTLILLIVLSMGVKAYAQTPLTLTVTVDSTSCSTCCDGTATLTASGGCPPYVYYTQPGGFTVGPVQTGLCQGTYTVTVTDNCGTPVSNTFQMKVAGTTNISNVNQEISDIYVLNPAKENFTFQFGQIHLNNSYEINITDVSGKTVLKNSITISEPNISIKHNLVNGIYFINVNQQMTNLSFKKKIVINN